LIVIAALLAAACEDFPDSQQDVEKLRILGVRSDKPDIWVTFSGDIPVFDPPSVKIDTLDADPKGGDRPVTRYLAACPPIAMDISENFNCDGANGFPLTDGTLNMMGYLRWLLGSSGGAAPLDPSQISEYLDELKAQLERGLPLLVWYRATAGDETAVSLKRITLRSGGDINHNPRFSGIMIEGEPLQSGMKVRAGRVFKFVPKIDQGFIEIYHDVNGKEQIESPVVVWYSTEGHFHDIYTGMAGLSNRWTSPVLDPGEEYRRADFYFVLEDLRGGLDWITVKDVFIVP
jgi:hypothetical protein